VRGTNTRATVLDGPVRAGELSKVVACHLRLDLDGVEDLAVVDANNAANHLRDNNHIPEVGLDDCGLFIRGSLLLGLAQLLDQTHWAALKATAETTACTRVNKFNELLIAHVKELVKINSTVGKCAEGSLLLELSSDCRVCNR